MTDDFMYVVPAKVDTSGSLILCLPTDILNQVGWDTGDKVLWEELPDGSFSIRKGADE